MQVSMFYYDYYIGFILAKVFSYHIIKFNNLKFRYQLRRNIKIYYITENVYLSFLGKCNIYSTEPSEKVFLSYLGILSQNHTLSVDSVSSVSTSRKKLLSKIY